MSESPAISPPSSWVMRFAPLIREGGTVLDVACGSGRHARTLAETGHSVTAVDRDISKLQPHERIEATEADLEGGAAWPFAGRTFDGIVVANYLHRPLFPVLIGSLSPGGALIYETFAIGNEIFGRPRNPDFLLRDGELLKAVAGSLSVVAYEAGLIQRPAPAVVQRIAAVNSPGVPASIPPPA